MEGGREQNYWPGFVDALSNVVLTLVFVLVVFVFALVIASNKVERKASEMVQAAHEQIKNGDASAIVAALKAELEKTKAENKELKDLQSSSAVEKTTNIVLEEKSGLTVIGAVTISRQQGKIVIDFPNAVSDLDAPSFDALGQALSEINVDIKTRKAKILSFIGSESYSAARRLAYYRILGLRNYLIDKQGMKGTSISTQIVQPKDQKNGRVEIIFD